MHEEVLSSEQKELLPLLSKFSNNFMLIGGTAVALHIGHRKSIDFDLITQKDLNINNIRELIRDDFSIQSVLIETKTEFTAVANNVKLSWIFYPFKIQAPHNFKDTISMPDLITLAATKAYALGRRAKWKDYVDLYFVFQTHSLSELVNKTGEIFGNEFNEKLFREQLAYFQDIDYSEKVEYMPNKTMDDDEVKQFLRHISVS